MLVFLDFLALLFLCSVILCLLIMRCLYSHVKKQALPHTYRNAFYLPPSFSFSLRYTHTNTHACLHTYIHWWTHTHTQTVSCALPTASSTKTERTACPCLTHIYTHTCAHTNSATSLYTLLKGHDMELKHKIPSCVTVDIALANYKTIKRLNLSKESFVGKQHSWMIN